jgi:hypothetical protein
MGINGCKCDHTAEGAIPLFLCRMGCNPDKFTDATRDAAIKEAPAFVDPITEQQRALRAKFAADKKAKSNAQREAWLKSKADAGERYNAKLKLWEKQNAQGEWVPVAVA